MEQISEERVEAEDNEVKYHAEEKHVSKKESLVQETSSSTVQETTTVKESSSILQATNNQQESATITKESSSLVQETSAASISKKDDEDVVESRKESRVEERSEVVEESMKQVHLDGSSTQEHRGEALHMETTESAASTLKDGVEKIEALIEGKMVHHEEENGVTTRRTEDAFREEHSDVIDQTPVTGRKQTFIIFLIFGT